MGSNSHISYSSSVPPNIVIKASLNNSEAGRELGREPPPMAVSPGDKKPPVPAEVLVKGIVSSEGGREGLGVRALKQKQSIVQKIFAICIQFNFIRYRKKVDLQCFFIACEL